MFIGSSFQQQHGIAPAQPSFTLPAPALASVRTGTTEVKGSLQRDPVAVHMFETWVKDLSKGEHLIIKDNIDRLVQPKNTPLTLCSMDFGKKKKKHAVLPVRINDTLLANIILSTNRYRYNLQTWSAYLYNSQNHTVELSEIKDKYLGGESNYISNFYELCKGKHIAVINSAGERHYLRAADPGFIQSCIRNMNATLPLTAFSNANAFDLKGLLITNVPQRAIAGPSHISNDNRSQDDDKEQIRKLKIIVAEKDAEIKSLKEDCATSRDYTDRLLTKLFALREENASLQATLNLKQYTVRSPSTQSTTV